MSVRWPFMSVLLLLAPAFASERVVQGEDLDCSKISQSRERPHSTGTKSAVTIGGVHYERSIPTRAESRLYIELDGKAVRFSAQGGISDTAKTSLVNFRGTFADVEYLVYGDGKLLKRSGRVNQGDPAASIEADISGVRELLLAVDGPKGAYANWVNARIAYTGREPRTVFSPQERAVKRAAVQPPEPRINSAAVSGVRPRTSFLYAIAATGRRLMTFSAKGLPEGLRLDTEAGIITGTRARPGEYMVTVGARNALGEGTKVLRIVVGGRLALTPPMGWNAWDVILGPASETVLKEMADAMVAYGLRDAGYEYINIDDSWVVDRDQEGRLVADPVRFPSGMKALADYLHARGFKLGIYSSPGATACAGYPGTLGHEETARRPGPGGERISSSTTTVAFHVTGPATYT